MKKIYVCSKVVGDEAMNAAKAYRYARFVATKCGQIPICPQIYFSESLMWSEMDPQYIKEASMELLRGCDEFWYFGDGVTMDMVDLLLMAREMNIPTRHISDKEMEQYPVQTKNKIGGK